MAWPTLAPLYRLTVGAILTLALLWASSATLAGAQAGTPACPPAASTGAVAPSGAAPTLGSATPSSEQVLACVGAEAITGATYLNWAAVARDAPDAHKGHKHARITNAEVAEQVMGFLVSSDWVIGEARERGIVIAEATVRRQFDRIRDQQFRHHGEFRKFLRSSGETVANLLFRVRLDLLSAQIQKQVLAGHRGARTQQRVLSNFVGEFKSRWTAQTYCEPAYAIADCGHVQSL
jgi:hypothetical protein